MIPGTGSDSASYNNERVVELECLDGGPPARRQANDLRAVFTPGKVLTPTLLPRVKQRNFLTSFRVDTLPFRLLVPVTRRARQARILSGGHSPVGTRNNVVNLALEAAEPYRGLAILAAVIGSLADQLTESSWNSWTRHWRRSATGFQVGSSAPAA